MYEIGTNLREARLRRGLDVPECEAETKIRAKYLRAMEEEQFELMPSPTYVRGFLRTYAEFLGLDGQLVLDEYESRFGDMDGPRDNGRGRGRGRAERGSGPRRLHGDGRDARPPLGRRPGAPARRRTEVQLLWLAIGGVMSVALLIWLGVANDSAGEAPISPAPPSAASIGTETEADTDTGEAPVPDLTTIRLKGVGDIGSYLQVRGGGPDGHVVFDGILEPGQSRRYAVRRAIWVSVGNPDGLVVTVDGRRREVPSGNSLLSREPERRGGG